MTENEAKTKKSTAERRRKRDILNDIIRTLHLDIPKSASSLTLSATWGNTVCFLCMLELGCSPLQLRVFEVIRLPGISCTEVSIDLVSSSTLFSSPVFASDQHQLCKAVGR